MTSHVPANFATTRWSIVNAAGRKSAQTSRVALEELCETYWPPVYAFIRRRGHAVTDAEDLTQSFFVQLLDSDFVQSADRDRGRFRSFLLKSVSHFLNDQHRARHTLKRGGSVDILSLDFDLGERQYRTEPAGSDSAEQLFERRWAMTLLQGTLSELRAEYVEKNHRLLFECLEAHLNQDSSRVPYAALTEKLNMSEDAIKQAARRMKLRYREILRTEISNTVGSPNDVDDELRQLMASLSG